MSILPDICWPATLVELELQILGAGAVGDRMTDKNMTIYTDMGDAEADAESRLNVRDKKDAETTGVLEAKHKQSCPTCNYSMEFSVTSFGTIGIMSTKCPRCKTNVTVQSRMAARD